MPHPLLWKPRQHEAVFIRRDTSSIFLLLICKPMRILRCVGFFVCLFFFSSRKTKSLGGSNWNLIRERGRSVSHVFVCFLSLDTFWRSWIQGRNSGAHHYFYPPSHIFTPAGLGWLTDLSAWRRVSVPVSNGKSIVSNPYMVYSNWSHN